MDDGRALLVPDNRHAMLGIFDPSAIQLIHSPSSTSPARTGLTTPSEASGKRCELRTGRW